MIGVFNLLPRLSVGERLKSVEIPKSVEMFMTRNITSRLQRFLCSTDGFVTVEVVLWMPVYFLVFIGSIDATLLMRAQTELWSVASDTSRLVAVRKLTVSEAEAYAVGLAGPGQTYTATVQSDGTTVLTRITRPFGDVTGLGFLTAMGYTLEVSSTHRVEPEV